MRRQAGERVPADKATRLTALIVIAAYLLLLLWLEPLIDLLLSLDPTLADPLAMTSLNEKKILYSSMAFATVRSLPLAMLLWLGYRVASSAGFPPAGMKFPIAVSKMTGRPARMFGIVLMGIGIFLIYWEMLQFSRKITGL